jgi:hypothetical protein
MHDSRGCRYRGVIGYNASSHERPFVIPEKAEMFAAKK